MTRVLAATALTTATVLTGASSSVAQGAHIAVSLSGAGKMVVTNIAAAPAARTPEDAYDACRNASNYVTEMARQEEAFLAVTDQFVAAQRAALPKEPVLDGSRPSDSDALAQWKSDFRQSYMSSWVGVRAPTEPLPSGPSSGFQDTYNYVRSMQDQYRMVATACRRGAPRPCRRMISIADTVSSSADAISGAAVRFSQDVFPPMREEDPSALYSALPGLLDTLTAGISAKRQAFEDAAGRIPASTKRCVKSMGPVIPTPGNP